MRRRRKSRILALFMLFSMEAQKGISLNQVKKIFNIFDNKLPSNVEPFAKKIVKGVRDNRSSLDPLIREYSQHWKFERMPIVDRLIILIALYELKFEPNTPPAVCINEAVDLAKMFSTPESGQFINGLLDNISKNKKPKSIHVGDLVMPSHKPVAHPVIISEASSPDTVSTIDWSDHGYIIQNEEVNSNSNKKGFVDRDQKSFSKKYDQPNQRQNLKKSSRTVDDLCDFDLPDENSAPIYSNLDDFETLDNASDSNQNQENVNPIYSANSSNENYDVPEDENDSEEEILNPIWAKVIAKSHAKKRNDRSDD